MKILIASDIHGCADSARKLIGHFQDEKCDYILLLGDILYHGPRNALPGEYDTMEVAKLLNQYKNKIWCVKGNCDSEVDQMVLEFPITADYMQIPVGDKVIFATHGHHFNMDYLPPKGSCDILACGHFHFPEHRQIEDLLYINPGSTSIPKGGSKKSFMTFDGKLLCWKEIDTGKTYDSLECD
ncbi:MAG: phosphodiesterase [Bacillota bacterium]|nr:phosphodiesterase [Bacillota bacterium]